MTYPLPANAGFYVGSPNKDEPFLWLGPYRTKNEADLHISRARRLLHEEAPERAPWIQLGVVRVVLNDPSATLPDGRLNRRLDPDSDAFRGLKSQSSDVRELDPKFTPDNVVVEVNMSTGARQYTLFRIRNAFPIPGETRLMLTLVDEHGGETTRMHPTNNSRRQILTPQEALDCACAFPNRPKPCDANGEPIGLSEAEILRQRIEAFADMHAIAPCGTSLGD